MFELCFIKIVIEFVCQTKEMESNENYNVKILVGNLLSQHPNASIRFIKNQLKGVSISESTIYRIKNKLKNNINLKRKTGSGRKRQELSPTSKRTLRRITDGKVALSWRSLAKKFGRSDKTIKKDVTDLRIIKKKFRPQKVMKIK